MLASCWIGRVAAITLLLAAPTWSAAAEEGLHWETNLEAAQRLALQTDRLVLIHFGAPWCPPCQRLEQQVFSQPGFGRELAASYVAVKLNFDHFPATARQFGIEAIPADVIITPQGQLVRKVQSPSSADAYVNAMNQIAVAARGPVSQPVAQNNAQRPPAAEAPPAPSSSERDRYADYYNRRGPEASPDPSVAVQQASGQEATRPATEQDPASAQGYCQVPPYQGDDRYADRGAPRQPPAPNPGNSAGPAAGAGAPPSQQRKPDPRLASRAAAPSTPRIPAGNPPLAMDGYCPVSLEEQRVWKEGDTRFGAIHRGRTYLFSGPSEQQKFLANPDRYSPVISGNDPVLALDQNQAVSGQREHGVFYNGRIYLFSSESSLDVFRRNPSRYAADIIQARR